MSNVKNQILLKKMICSFEFDANMFFKKLVQGLLSHCASTSFKQYSVAVVLK